MSWSKASLLNIKHARDSRGVPRANVLVEGSCCRVAIARRARTKQVVHVVTADVSHIEMWPRRLGGCRVREPRADGRFDGAVAHGVAPCRARRHRRRQPAGPTRSAPPTRSVQASAPGRTPPLQRRRSQEGFLRRRTRLPRAPNTTRIRYTCRILSRNCLSSRRRNRRSPTRCMSPSPR